LIWIFSALVSLFGRGRPASNSVYIIGCEFNYKTGYP
jgi:hypothetical protein